jgi:hypothetical protein
MAPKSKKVSAESKQVEQVAEAVVEVAPVQLEAVKPAEAPKAKRASKAKASKVEEPAPAEPVAEEAGEQEGGDGETKPKVRYFKCIYNGTQQGRYKGGKPKQAANKGFTYIIKHHPDLIGQEVTFQMLECTRGRNKKVSTYTGVRRHLDNPVTVEIKNGGGPAKQIVYKFSNKVTKVKENQEGGEKAKPKAKSAKKEKKVTKAKSDKAKPKTEKKPKSAKGEAKSEKAKPAAKAKSDKAKPVAKKAEKKASKQK